MNILLYLHGNIDLSEKIQELINIACLWKRITNGRLYITISKEKKLSIKNKLEEWEIDKIFILEDSKEDTLKKTSSFFEKISKMINIDCIVMGNSIFERELAPYIASIYQWQFVPNIIDFKIEGKDILWKRFLYGTRAIQKFTTDSSSIVVTVSSNIYKKDERRAMAKHVEYVNVSTEEETEILFTVESVEQKILQKHPLENAKMVIGVGKGIKNKENFLMIEELADLLGATIGVTRSVVDNGWRPEYEKIGQTGKIIKPELYLGFGISGAMQHMAGVRQARHIIMVNNNPNAESFRSSDFGIVADLFDVIPRIIKFIKNKKSL
ncbi:electron transfer flavoprotein subunit alpha/FixB family protein [Fusobacterium sp.]|uniref:electron transfer flavoprotein subunit alpha/FixB family protein n=1 Tax=Fusobacterium sp. TaxID=68766 RepID=UPI002904AD13|nr:electron transfer flavoprotein subunit alpha/FixB family protein [Fusobacterium sp.]MDU1911015.1 electron transfer flavoprotein subunit alpha/FixB family protein [Fusobacterium sp.]